MRINPLPFRLLFSVFLMCVPLFAGVSALSAEEEPFLAPWNPDVPYPLQSEVCFPEGAEHVIVQDCDTDPVYGFLHETAVGEFNGEIIAGWYNNPKSELAGKTIQRARRSADFWHWSELETVQDLGNDEGLMYVGLQFLTKDGKLYCFTNQEHGGERPTQCLLQVWEPETKTWKILGPIGDKFLSMQQPMRMENGNYVISGSLMPPTRDINGTTPVVFISQGADIEKPWRMVRIDPQTDYVNIFAETGVVVDGAHLLAVTRLEKSPFPNFYESSDFGETWRKIENRTFAASSSKFAAGRFSNGFRYIVYNLPVFKRDADGKIIVKYDEAGNPTTEGIGMGRNMLVIAVARPGEKAFSTIWKVSDVTSSTKQTASHYPCVLEHDGYVYVSYTGNHRLRNCGVTRFPLKSLEEDPAKGEVLYNGIQLPKAWPPNRPFSREVQVPPYLRHRPEVVKIDVGRQLFVDDFLIESTDMTRNFHYPQKSPENPILKPETPVEMNGGNVPCATLFNDAVVYDPTEKNYKMWYHAGWFDGTGLAVSQDGIRWTRPELDVVPGTNRVLPAYNGARQRDGATQYIDVTESDPQKRFKMFLYERTYTEEAKPFSGGQIYSSPDGVHWKFETMTSGVGDNTTVNFNPFRNKWIYSVRTGGMGRARSYRECDNLIAGAKWTSEMVPWLCADELDVPDPEITAMRPTEDELQKMAAGDAQKLETLRQENAAHFYGNPTQLYNFDAAGYESIMLGVFAIHYGPENHICAAQKTPKNTELELGYSRDGFHFSRPDRTAFLHSVREDGSWEKGYLHIASTVYIADSDHIYFYYGAFSGDSPKKGGDLYGGGGVGVAILRRDGFCSMDAPSGTGEKVLTTRPVIFGGRFPFVNLCVRGSLRVELLDADGNVLPGFSRENCEPLSGDACKKSFCWKNTDGSVSDLSTFAGRPVRFRFFMTDGALYSFWVSASENGESGGKTFLAPRP